MARIIHPLRLLGGPTIAEQIRKTGREASLFALRDFSLLPFTQPMLCLQYKNEL
jgi:hypothetical protein